MGEFLLIPEVASAWGCDPARVAWLAQRGHLRGFYVGKRHHSRSFRIRAAEVGLKRHLADVQIPPAELAQFDPKTPRPKRALEPLEAKMLAAISRLKPTERGCVYFIQCCDFVKVGFTENPLERVYALRVASPFDIICLKVIAGSREREAALQKCLDEFHHRLEWFRLTPELASAIKRLPARREFRHV